MDKTLTQQDILLRSAQDKIDYLKDSHAWQMGEARENLLNAIKEYVALNYKFKIGDTINIYNREYIVQEIEPNIYRKLSGGIEYDFLVTTALKNDLLDRLKIFASMINNSKNGN